MKKYCILLYLAVLPLILLGQDNTKVDSLQIYFDAFDYDKIISLSNELLKNEDSYSGAELLNIYQMKSIAHYSLGEIDSTRNAFISMLLINPGYELDPVSVSPKIITLFNNVKANFVKINSRNTPDEPEERATIVNKTDTLYVNRIVKVPTYTPYLKNIAFPGWGYFERDEHTEGFLYSAFNTVLLGSIIYYVIDCNSKYNDYLNETDVDKIGSLYDDYNDAYKLRNSLFAGYAAFWIFSQVNFISSSTTDFENDLKSENSFSVSFTLAF